MPRAPARLHWRKAAQLRAAALERAGHRCERCGKGPPLEAHHPDRDRWNPDARLEVLCRGCHIEEHDRLKGQPKARAWRDMVRALLVD